MTLTYVRCYSEDGENLGLIRFFDEEVVVGTIFERYMIEGYVNWEVLSIKENAPVFNNNKSIDVVVKQHPYVKTHCDHEWKNWTHPSIIVEFRRQCSKCGIQESYDYMTCKWSQK